MVATLIAPAELACTLGISRNTLYRWNARRLLPAPLRLNNSLRWHRSDIEAWLNDQRQDDGVRLHSEQHTQPEPTPLALIPASASDSATSEG